MRKKIDIFLIFLFFLSIFIFLAFPEIDIAVSSLFFKEEVGFYLSDSIFAKTIYKSTILMIKIFAAFLFLILVSDILLKKDIFNIRKKVIIYLLTVLILGPGLVVNYIFKNHWGRARPMQIERFGGDKKFTPAFIKTDQCEKNCSFTSGHAAVAFYFLALVPLFKKKRSKILALFFALFWGSLVGFVRIIQGGHFLSDVIFSGFFVYFVARIVYFIMFERVKDEKTLSSYSSYE